MTFDSVPLRREQFLEAMQLAGLPLLDQLMTVAILDSDNSEDEKSLLLGLNALARDHEPDDPHTWEDARAIAARLYAIDRDHKAGALDTAAYETRLHDVIDPVPLDVWLCVMHLQRSDAQALVTVMARTPWKN